MLTVDQLKPGEKAKIVEIVEGCHPAHHHHDWYGYGRRRGVGGWGRYQLDQLQCMGARSGKQLEVLTNAGVGPILIKIDESRIAIGRGVARRIMVSKEEEEVKSDE